MSNLDDVSSEYDLDSEPATATENRLLLPWYARRIVRRIGHCESLLELGIGHGLTSGIFRSACDRQVVVEGSSRVIRQYRSRFPNSDVSVVEALFEAFETDDRFDVIVMGFVLEHVDDPAAVLARYRRFLKPEGRLFIAVPNAKSLNRRLGLELGKIDDIFALNDNDIALGHKRQFSRETLNALVREQRFRVTHEEGIYLKPLPLDVLRKLENFEANLEAMMAVGIDFPDLCVALLMEAVLG